jgi:hypothetical protein
MPIRTVAHARWRRRYQSKAYRAYHRKYHKVLGIIIGHELYVSANREGFMRKYLAKQPGYVAPPMSDKAAAAKAEHARMMAAYELLPKPRHYDPRINHWPDAPAVTAFLAEFSKPPKPKEAP